MKTIYTDRYALRLWIWLFLAGWFLFNGVTPPFSWRSVIWLAGSAFWAWQAVKELKRRRGARERGEDPSIYKIVDDGAAE